MRKKRHRAVGEEGGPGGGVWVRERPRGRCGGEGEALKAQGEGYWVGAHLGLDRRNAHGRGAREVRALPAQLVLAVRAAHFIALPDEDREDLLDLAPRLQFDGQSILHPHVRGVGWAD